MKNSAIFMNRRLILLNKKIFKLPIFTLIGGIILRIINHFIILVMVRGTNEWTLEMGTTHFYIDLTLSIIIFVIVGIILRKTYDWVDFLKAATLLTIYSIVILTLEQATQYIGIYGIGFSLFFYLPIEIFTIITSTLARISTAETISLIYAIPSLFAPYLFVFFARKSESRNKKTII